MAKIQEAAIPNLRAQIDELTASAEDGAAGIVFSAINKKGETIFEHASGTLGVGKPEPMTLDSIFWIASCTKMITGVACMQLVEQGKISLDSVEEVEKICPVSLFSPSSDTSFWGNGLGSLRVGPDQPSCHSPRRS
jgi:hypothetical protein